MAKRQVLSDESMNSKGFIVLNDGVVWSRYKKNPVLLVEHEDSSVPIGKITDIRLDAGKWTGALVFAGTERGGEAERLYNDGFYNAVSIGGTAKKARKDGRDYAVEFVVYEVSLVAVPANENAVSYESGENLHVIFNEKNDGSWIETLSASESEIITKYIKMEEQLKHTEEVAEEVVEQLSGEGNDEDPGEPEELKAAPEEKEPGFVKTILSAIAAAFKPEVKEEELNAYPKEEEAEVEEEVELKAAETAKVYEQKIQVKQQNMKIESLQAWLNSAEGGYKMGEVAKLSRKSIGNEQLSMHPDNGQVIDNLREFASKLAADPVVMEFMKEVRFDVNGGRSESVGQMADRLSSGFNTANFLENTPDLGKAVWLSMFLQQLLPENSWAARTQKASGADKVGMIWIQSAINPAIYMGGRAPLNATNYLYDDIARALVTKVFSVQPILWQPSNTDILPYNDQATGMAETARLVAECMHQFTLQTAGEEAGEIVTMTGPNIAADGWFPNLNPAATGNISSLSVQDLALLTAKFINENFQMDMYQGTLVLDARYAAAFKTDDNVTSILRKNAGDVRTRFTQFDAWDIYSRSRVLGYDTAASALIDPEWYLDGKVQQDGSIPAYTPPVIPATTYGAGLAFMPNQIIMAMGNTNVHMVSDPNNYGWKVSADIRFGAGVMREDGVGVKVIVPAVA